MKKQFSNSTIQQSVLDVLKYFSFFNYPPTFEEIYAFLKKKAPKRRITGILENMQKKSLIVRFSDYELRITNINNKKKEQNTVLQSLIRNPQLLINNFGRAARYTLGEYKNSNITIQQYNNLNKRQMISINKLNSVRFRTYLKILNLLPQIKLVGLSGSVAMFNADEDHDVDLFIITAKNRLWTGRIITILLAKLLGIHRDYHSSNITIQQYSNSFKDRVCLNLFFDESDLKIPKFKQSGYVAHEVLQMKPLTDKNNTYLRFIDTNRWVFDIFPNAKNNSESRIKSSELNSEVTILNSKSILNFGFIILNLFTDKIESILKILQLYLIRNHRTTEIITDSQLWFHPDDFEKKIKK